ncbi:ABC transporter ATP-binding protein [Aerococcus sp. UMB1112A]|uniref:ABC transporter ATP-binding protein n=1 Tax=Aerococcus sp. UMB1112A TaxID=3050609 RepID=UPI00254F9D1F|nr:ABC transporter ATP-binding protein [Aerococcus sp. UMB1112A]MDK8502628.1 ABC transporter ATP-binding protein [Aerococcus sp. UMB1112A]
MYRTIKGGGAYEIFKEILPKRRSRFAILFLSILTAIFAIVIPQIISILFNPEMIESVIGNRQLIFSIVALLVAIQAIQGLSSYLISKIGIKAMESIQSKIYRKVINLPFPVISDMNSGDLSSRVTNDTGVVTQLVTVILPSILSNSIIIVGSLVFLISISLPLTLLVASFIPLLMILRFPINRKIEALNYRIKTQVGKISGYIIQRIRNIKEIKTLGTEDQEVRYGNSLLNKLFVNMRKIIKIEILINTLTSILILVYICLLFYLTYSGYYYSNISLDSLILYFLYLFTVMSHIIELLEKLSKYSECKGALNRLEELMRVEEEDKRLDRNPIDNCCPLRLENVSFSYDGNTPVLTNVSMEFPEKTFTAIIGDSGIGKSTIFNLLLGFYNTYDGRISFCGNELRDCSLEDIRDKMFIISQDKEWLEATVKDNLLYGIDRNISFKEIEEVLEKVALDDFIEKLDVYMNETGSNFSEGQKQRLSIARCLLSHKPIILFDEPISHLDVQSGEIIMQLIKELSQEKCVIVISHNINSVAQADNIYVMTAKGQALDSGRREDLIGTSETYKDIYGKYNFLPET